jgi:hypothetical protein
VPAEEAQPIPPVQTDQFPPLASSQKDDSNLQLARQNSFAIAPFAIAAVIS